MGTRAMLRDPGRRHSVRRLLSACIAGAIVASAFCSTAAAAVEPQPYGTNDFRGFRNILPPGQDGHANAAQVIAFTGLGSVFDDPVQNQARPPHASDQLNLYEDL